MYFKRLEFLIINQQENSQVNMGLLLLLMFYTLSFYPALGLSGSGKLVAV